jgi:type IV pilus assembly protein PilV
MTPKRSQQGVSLIEVLVAAVIIAIGLLGLAGLQTRSLQMNQSAHYRSQANYFAYAMVDALRMNESAAESGGFNTDMSDGPPGGTTVADETLERWKKSIDDTLPTDSSGNTGGSVEVTTTSTPDTTKAVITVAWVDERWSEDAGDQVREVSVRTEL